MLLRYSALITDKKDETASAQVLLHSYPLPPCFLYCMRSDAVNSDAPTLHKIESYETSRRITANILSSCFFYRVCALMNDAVQARKRVSNAKAFYSVKVVIVLVGVAGYVQQATSNIPTTLVKYIILHPELKMT